jgi:hypothetical protein
MDPHAVLGLPHDASLEEATVAYRALAKSHHPDVTQDPRAAEVMARINAAFDELRARAAAGTLSEDMAAAGPTPSSASAAAAGGRRERGTRLPDATPRALGAELLSALEQEERVTLVVPTATWASPETRLALTDRRLLWLADDQPTHRIRSLRFRDVAEVDFKLNWPRRRGTASVRVRNHAGRRFDFGDIRPDIALTIAQTVSGRI